MRLFIAAAVFRVLARHFVFSRSMFSDHCLDGEVSMEDLRLLME